MKKIIFGALMCMTALTGMAAQPITPRHDLLLNLTDDQTVTYHFSQQPVATFSGDNLVLTVTDGPAVEYPMENIVNITFADDLSGVQTVRPSAGIEITVTNTTLTVTGLAPDAVVNVFDMGGHALVSARADAQGSLSASIESLPKGIYTVATGRHSFKFIK